MHERVVAEVSRRAQPKLLAIRRPPSLPRDLAHEAEVESVEVGEGLLEIALFVSALARWRERLRFGDVGDRVAVDETVFVDVERARKRQDRLAVLDPDDVAGREGATVPDAVYLVEDRVVRVARAEEVGVQGVDAATLDRAPRGDEGLRGDLAAEDAPPRLVEADAPEDVHLDLLEVEQVNEARPVIAHGQTVHSVIMRNALRHPFASALEFRRSPQFGRFWRYSAVSAVSTVISLSGLYLFFRVLHVGSAAVSNLIATSIASIPAYYLNRTWSWGKSGRSHVLREVVPFWAITAFGVIASTIVVHFAANFAYHLAHTHRGREVTIIVEFANLATYGVLWIGKFLVFNRFLFRVDPVARTEPDVDTSMREGVIAPSTRGVIGATIATDTAAIAVAPEAARGETLSGVEL